jgi:hypothetical protein
MAEHRHAWTYGDVMLVDGRPVLLQRCPCGADRSIRAFERSWQPPPIDPVTEPHEEERLRLS